MSEWIQRNDWHKPVSDHTYVEISGRDRKETRRGFARDFFWGYNEDGEGNIHYYRVLSELALTAKQRQTIIVEIPLPCNEILQRFPDDITASLFMVWWRSDGVRLFYEYIDSLEE